MGKGNRHRESARSFSEHIEKGGSETIPTLEIMSENESGRPVATTPEGDKTPDAVTVIYDDRKLTLADVRASLKQDDLVEIVDTPLDELVRRGYDASAVQAFKDAYADVLRSVSHIESLIRKKKEVFSGSRSSLQTAYDALVAATAHVAETAPTQHVGEAVVEGHTEEVTSQTTSGQPTGAAEPLRSQSNLASSVGSIPPGGVLPPREGGGGSEESFDPRTARPEALVKHLEREEVRAELLKRTSDFSARLLSDARDYGFLKTKKIDDLDRLAAKVRKFKKLMFKLNASDGEYSDKEGKETWYLFNEIDELSGTVKENMASYIRGLDIDSVPKPKKTKSSAQPAIRSSGGESTSESISEPKNIPTTETGHSATEPASPTVTTGETVRSGTLSGNTEEPKETYKGDGDIARLNALRDRVRALRSRTANPVADVELIKHINDFEKARLDLETRISFIEHAVADGEDVSADVIAVQQRIDQLDGVVHSLESEQNAGATHNVNSHVAPSATMTEAVPATPDTGAVPPAPDAKSTTETEEQKDKRIEAELNGMKNADLTNVTLKGAANMDLRTNFRKAWLDTKDLDKKDLSKDRLDPARFYVKEKGELKKMLEGHYASWKNFAPSQLRYRLGLDPKELPPELATKLATAKEAAKAYGMSVESRYAARLDREVAAGRLNDTDREARMAQFRTLSVKRFGIESGHMLNRAMSGSLSEAQQGAFGKAFSYYSRLSNGKKAVIGLAVAGASAGTLALPQFARAALTATGVSAFVASGINRMVTSGARSDLTKTVLAANKDYKAADMDAIRAAYQKGELKVERRKTVAVAGALAAGGVSGYTTAELLSPDSVVDIPTTEPVEPNPPLPPEPPVPTEPVEPVTPNPTEPEVPPAPPVPGTSLEDLKREIETLPGKDQGVDDVVAGRGNEEFGPRAREGVEAGGEEIDDGDVPNDVPPPEAFRGHTVVKGDTIWDIAEKEYADRLGAYDALTRDKILMELRANLSSGEGAGLKEIGGSDPRGADYIYPGEVINLDKLGAYLDLAAKNVTGSDFVEAGSLSSRVASEEAAQIPADAVGKEYDIENSVKEAAAAEALGINASSNEIPVPKPPAEEINTPPRPPENVPSPVPQDIPVPKPPVGNEAVPTPDTESSVLDSVTSPEIVGAAAGSLAGAATADRAPVRIEADPADVEREMNAIIKALGGFVTPRREGFFRNLMPKSGSDTYEQSYLLLRGMTLGDIARQFLPMSQRDRLNYARQRGIDQPENFVAWMQNVDVWRKLVPADDSTTFDDYLKMVSKYRVENGQRLNA